MTQLPVFSPFAKRLHAARPFPIEPTLAARLQTRSLAVAAAASLMLVLAACSSTPLNTKSAMATNTSAALMPGAASTAGAKASSDVAVATVDTARAQRSMTLPPHLDPKSALATKRSVYFGFDQFTIDAQYAALIERHGSYLASHPTVTLRVEGNTDERGGSEYNLALGQKRAEAVARALAIYGVRAAQLEPVSWGESKPKDRDSNERSWAENRRADLDYLSP